MPYIRSSCLLLQCKSSAVSIVLYLTPELLFTSLTSRLRQPEVQSEVNDNDPEAVQHAMHFLCSERAVPRTVRQ